MIHMGKYKRNDQRIGKDGRQGRQPFPFSESISTERAQQGCKTAKHNIPGQTAGKKICEDAADKQSGYGGRGKIG